MSHPQWQMKKLRPSKCDFPQLVSGGADLGEGCEHAQTRHPLGPLHLYTTPTQPPRYLPLSCGLEATVQLASVCNVMPSTHTFVLPLAYPINVITILRGFQTPSHSYSLIMIIK